MRKLLSEHHQKQESNDPNKKSSSYSDELSFEYLSIIEMRNVVDLIKLYISIN